MAEEKLSGKDGIELTYVRSNTAVPMVAWEDVNYVLLRPSFTASLNSVIHAVAQDSAALEQLPDFVRDSTIQLHEYHQIDIKALKGKDEQYLIGLLAYLSIAGYEAPDSPNQEITRAIEYLREEAGDYFPKVVESVSLNGRELPLPSDTIVRTGDAWSLVKRHNTLTDSSINILTIPTDTRSSDHANLYKISGIFLSGDELNFTEPQQTYHVLLKTIASDSESDIFTYAAVFERYLTRMYEASVKVAAFLRWAEADESTIPVAELLRIHSDQAISTEIQNFTQFPIKRDDQGLLHYISGFSLPDLEIPTQTGRATGYVSLGEHARILSSLPGYTRSDEQWQEEIAALLWHPFEY